MCELTHFTFFYHQKLLDQRKPLLIMSSLSFDMPVQVLSQGSQIHKQRCLLHHITVLSSLLFHQNLNTVFQYMISVGQQKIAQIWSNPISVTLNSRNSIQKQMLHLKYLLKEKDEQNVHIKNLRKQCFKYLSTYQKKTHHLCGNYLKRKHKCEFQTKNLVQSTKCENKHIHS